MAFAVRQGFGRYMALGSHLHNLDPLVKIVLFVIVIACVLLSSSWYAIAYVAAYIVVLCAVSKVGFLFYFDSLKHFTWMFALSFAINVIFPRGSGRTAFSPEALSVAGIFSSRLVLMILSATILTVVTSPSEIGDSMLLLSRVGGRTGRRVADFAALLSISLRFVPVMFEEAERIKAAQTLRGMSTSGLGNRLRFTIGLVTPLLESSLRRASNLGFALDARCYGYCIPRVPGLNLAVRDFILAGSGLAVLIGLIAMR